MSDNQGYEPVDNNNNGESQEKLVESRSNFRTATIILIIVSVILLGLMILFAVYTYRYYLLNYNYVSVYTGPSCPKRYNRISFPSLDGGFVNNTISAVDNYLQSVLDDLDVETAFVHATYDNNIFVSLGYGSFDPTNITYVNGTQVMASAPNATTVFGFESLGSLLTVISLLQQVQSGNMSLDENIMTYFPQLQINDPLGYMKHNITLRHLASHTSGLPRNPPCDPYNCNLSTSQILANLQTFPQLLVREVGSQPSYSLLGMALLAKAVESKVTQAGYNNLTSYMMSNIVHPLKMFSTALYPTPSPLDVTAVAVTKDPDNFQFYAVPQKQLYWLTPVMQWYSTPKDVGILMGELVNYQSQLILSADMKSLLFTPESAPDTSGRSLFTVGFASVLKDNYWIGVLDGAINGYSANLVVVPELSLTVLSVSTQVVDNSILSVGSADVIIGQLESNFAANSTIQAIPQPTDSSPYIGSFAATYSDGTNHTIDIASSPKGLQITFDANGDNTEVYSLMYQSALGNSVLKMVRSPDNVDSCLALELLAFEGQIVVFSANNNQVSVPGMHYGVQFTRVVPSN